MPLDPHLTQDAFFRTISAISHDEIDIRGSRYVRISVQGDSFLLHQVRRMIGALILTAKGIFSEDVLRAAIDSPFRILTPRAPSQGLLLRDARFLDVDFKGRDTEPSTRFARDFIYPHMHHKWTSLDPSEDAEVNDETFNTPSTTESVAHNLTSNTLAYNPWDELNSMTPITNVRDIIPGYDDWISWYTQTSAEREMKRELRRSHFEERRLNKGRTPLRVTTRESF